MMASRNDLPEQQDEAVDSGPAPPVELPKTIQEFKSKVPIPGPLQNESQTLANEVPIKSGEQQIIKYSGTALQTGRPLDRVMIVMAGQSGAGKSTTINTLFDDEICPTSTDSSETADVTEYGKVLHVTLESPSIKGVLSCVDVPGALDGDQSKEPLNHASIVKFRKEHVALLCRKVPQLKGFEIKESVYPNLVLMTIKAGDNRMVGNDTSFQKSLKTLKSCHIVDSEVTNLIVVVTHAMTIPKKKYKERTHELKEKIQLAVKAVVGIKNVKVVFVENQPDDYDDMLKPDGTDFYQLPDGELSHHNLIMAMNGLFHETNDYLGRLFCGWYFSGSCPDKEKKPDILHTVGHSSITEEEFRNAQHDLGRLRIVATEEKKEPEHPEFEFEFIGRGYDPKTETTKNVNVYSGNDTNTVEIHGRKYTVPACLKIVRKHENYSHLLSCETKETYIANRLATYGLEADVTLVVKVDSRGRWIRDTSSANKKSVVTILHEIRLANVRMDEPEKNSKDDLMSAFKVLETPYSDKNAHMYNEFFSKWGTHIICELSLGGFMEVNHTVSTSTFDEKQGLELLSAVQVALRANASAGGERAGKSSQNQNLQDQTMVLSGGTPPDVTSLIDFTPEMRAQWVESLKENPTELKHSFKLYPYYNMVKGELVTSLRQATVEYLNDAIAGKLPTTRNGTAVAMVDSVAKEKGTECFPPYATVFVNNRLVAFKDLEPGTEVLTVEYSNGWKCRNTKILTYIHYDPEMTAEFLNLHLDNGRTITVTGNHLIFVKKQCDIRAVRASTAHVGDKLIFVDALCKSSETPVVTPVSITAITSSTIKGVYCPLTSQGTLIVDGTLVSCYANIDSHSIAHFSMMPLRLWYTACQVWNSAISLLEVVLPISEIALYPKFGQTREASGIHKFASLLMVVRRALPFKLLQE